MLGARASRGLGAGMPGTGRERLGKTSWEMEIFGAIYSDKCKKILI
jgi:hypothetical protein